MKLSAVFLAALAQGDESNEEPRRGVRGFLGPQTVFDGESPYPIKGK